VILVPFIAASVRLGLYLGTLARREIWLAVDRVVPRYTNDLDVSQHERQMIFEDNARRVYPRLDQKLNARGL
jgi:hypothetical protein